ncbi:DNA-directed RNA polymerase III subunit RPC1-like protein [Sarcoptes scabiei]|uniref:DNA-directed RNA polymerase subunit n=1 Tax=Sarcoptes scabiei TaxID=52283 RepID=A0A131ZWH1_SARSC|nr:DNA-directed RNA polymerase III subunit RPC1-like protein [Sarcoptes scabiei]
MQNGIQTMNFRILSADDIQRHAVIKVTNSILYDGLTNNPTKNGLLDRRLGSFCLFHLFIFRMQESLLNFLGVGSKNQKCETCELDSTACVGHFGCLELVYPVYHVGYFKYTIEILQSICKRCAKVLLPIEARNRYRPKLKENMNPLVKKMIHREIIAHCKKISVCPHCDFKNGQIKKFTFMKIFHLLKANETIMLQKIFENNKGSLEEILNYFGNSCEYLTPQTVLRLFEKIPRSDYVFLLLFNNTPMDLICTHLPVPPCIIRPSSHNNTGLRSTEDELTMKLNEILIANESLKKRIQDGSVFSHVIDTWDFLQILVSVYINSDVRNLPPQHSSVASGQGIAQRLKGKEGRFRANLSGKRVNFSSRTVISPDPNLGIDEVGIPLKIASHMTYPVAVTPYNISLMRELVRNGPYNHPGAIFIYFKNRKVHLGYVDRQRVAMNLKYGDVVHRHMLNGDYVLFNRQPSLHRLSIMCHRVRIHPDQTFKFNVSVCSPYNADFDGDEMNVHFLQTEEAKAEASVLMQSKSNLNSPRNGEPVISPIQDFITSAYLMTKRDVFYSREEIFHLLGMLINSNGVKSVIKIPKPAVIKPFPLWTGKQLFSSILRPYLSTKTKLNIKLKTKSYSSNEEHCINEGFIHIRNGELLSGTIDKSVIGGGSKNNIFYLILKQYDADESIKAMLNLCRTTTNLGFSIGIDDVTPNNALLEQKNFLMSNGYMKVQRYIDQFNRGLLNPFTGLTREQTLESLILKELSEIRDHAGKACIKQMSHKNSPLVMANCGSKGSYINISQMAVCVGQQSIRGQRVPEGFHQRVLPHFGFNDKSPVARGFVANSFYSGLNPFEFFFHAMAGREGLLDTAVKTAETGYMQRRLIKGLEDIVVHYDYSVRNSDGEIIQFDYGDDRLDPINMETSDHLVDYGLYWNNIVATNKFNNEKVLTSAELVLMIEELFNTNSNQNIEKSDSPIRQQIKNFLQEKVLNEIKNAENSKFFGKCNQPNRITATHVREFVSKMHQKSDVARIEPGTAIGAICAQSIGEPTTQMTLKTFHFAGVASMNITQGVPRITEIINATKNPSTPFIKAELSNPYSATLAESVKMRIEKIYLDQISEKIYQTYSDNSMCFIIKLNHQIFKQLEISETTLYEEIVSQMKPKYCKIIYPYIKLIPSVKKMLYLPKMFEDDISNVFISGNRHIQRVTIREDQGKFYLMIEGNGFLEILGTKSVDHCRTFSNNIHEVASVLGIEAARTTIIDEINSTMKNHGITIDKRHLMLLADTMTASGQVVGMTRSGFSKVKSSTIKMASVRILFERTIDNLYLSSYYNNKDDLRGASECIIVGAPTKMGTGFFDVFPRTSSAFTKQNLSYNMVEGVKI